MADDTDMPVALIPLSDLYIHPLNTRTEPPPADIEALADSIAELGLLQNLAGYLDHGHQTGIVAGGRRLRALQMLAARDGRDPAEIMVPVRVTGDEATARLWASAENAARQALSPADEVRAYGRMAAQGADPNRIARAFAVTERHVKQRLKLATLPAEALDALRAGEISLDQAAAMTVTDDAEALSGVLRQIREDRARGWAPPGFEQIRRMLTPDAVAATDRRAVFVGLDEYRADGGLIQTDLFTDQVRLLDPAKLDRLFREKLSAVADMLRQAGGWAAAHVSGDGHFDYNAAEKFEEVYRTPVDLPEADEEEYLALAARDHEGDDLTDAEHARMDELAARKAGDWTDGDRARSTLFLWVDRHGQLCHRAFAPRGSEAAGADDDDDDTATAAPKPEKLSQALVDDLRILRRLAVQTALLDQPELVLDLLTVSLIAPVWDWHRPLALKPTVQQLEPSKHEGTLISDRLVDAVNDGRAVGDRRDLHPGDLAEVRALGKKGRNAALTAALAALFCRHDGAFMDHVAGLIGADVRKVWTPTAEGHFARLPVSMLDRIWADLVPPEAVSPEAFAGQKKAEKAQDLHALFNDHAYREALGLDRDTCARIDAWLPAELQFGEDTE